MTEPGKSEVVSSAIRRCFASPTIFEGTLVNGDDYFLYYDHGYAKFQNLTTNMAATIDQYSLTEGYLSDKDFDKIIVQLNGISEEKFNYLLSKFSLEAEPYWRQNNPDKKWENFLELVDEKELRLALGRAQTLGLAVDQIIDSLEEKINHG